MTQIATEPRRTSLFVKVAFKAQVFLLRRNWMGGAGKVIMVITTTGRKSGKQFSIPIGYQHDGDSVLAFSIGGQSNWYKNIAQNPLVTLEIQTKAYPMQGTYVTDTHEITRILELYKRENPSLLPRFFGISAESSGDDLMKATEKVRFVRFTPL